MRINKRVANNLFKPFNELTENQQIAEQKLFSRWQRSHGFHYSSTSGFVMRAMHTIWRKAILDGLSYQVREKAWIIDQEF